MKTRLAGCSTVVVLACALARPANSQEQFGAWVSLYENEAIGWLENENRLSQLCNDSATFDECYLFNLAPKLSAYELHSLPDASSDRIGDLIVVAVPGRGLTAHFRATGSSLPAVFTPDLFLQDWGYGPYFHQTFTNRRGDWFQLPPDPWDDAVWLKRVDGEPHVIAVHPGEIIEWNGAGWYVVAGEQDALVLRPEQPADMWCEEGDPPPLEPVRPTRYSRAALVDPRGHLSIRVKYMKGCKAAVTRSQADRGCCDAPAVAFFSR